MPAPIYYGNGGGVAYNPFSLSAADQQDAQNRQRLYQQNANTQGNQTALQTAMINAMSNNFGATTAANAGIRTAQENSASNRYQADLSADTARQGQANALAQAKLPFDFRTAQLDKFGGTINTALSAIGGQGGFNPSVWANQVSAPPPITFGDGGADKALRAQLQVQQGQNTQIGQTAQRNAVNDVTSRGYGSGSPLLMALQAGIGTGTRVANSEAAASTNVEAAKLQASREQTAAQLAQQQYVDYQNAINNSQKLGLSAFGQQSQNAAQLLAALSNLIG